jgi:hypothetical protein
MAGAAPHSSTTFPPSGDVRPGDRCQPFSGPPGYLYQSVLNQNITAMSKNILYFVYIL